MEDIQIFLIGAAQATGVVLFLYVLYLLGGMAQDIKQILAKIRKLEKQLAAKEGV